MTLAKYSIGFLLSLAVTLAAYVLVVRDLASGMTMLVTLTGLALLQMIIQLVYFLHLNEEQRPRYRAISFVFMFAMLLIVVVGTLWIMHHLDYNMMQLSPDQKNEYMLKEHDKGF